MSSYAPAVSVLLTLYVVVGLCFHVRVHAGRDDLYLRRMSLTCLGAYYDDLHRLSLDSSEVGVVRVRVRQWVFRLVLVLGLNEERMVEVDLAAVSLPKASRNCGLCLPFCFGLGPLFGLSNSDRSFCSDL